MTATPPTRPAPPGCAAPAPDGARTPDTHASDLSTLSAPHVNHSPPSPATSLLREHCSRSTAATARSSRATASRPPARRWDRTRRRPPSPTACARSDRTPPCAPPPACRTRSCFRTHTRWPPERSCRTPPASVPDTRLHSDTASARSAPSAAALCGSGSCSAG